MKRNLLLIAVIGLGLMACTSKKERKTYPFYLGTYTEGDSEGIYQGLLRADGSFDTLHLAAKSTNPSFLCFANGKKTLLAVNEVDVDSTGTIEAFTIAARGLTKVSESISGGAHPCYVSANTKGDVLVANYSGGNIGYVRVDASGELSPLLAVAQHFASGTVARQTEPHAHSIWFMDEKQAVAADLGIDQLLFYQLSDNKLRRVDSLKLQDGSGPRHLAIHPNKKLLYVINELDNTITVVAKRGSGWQALSSVSTLPKGFNDKSYCADIHLSSDGRFVYASNRGHNSLAIFKTFDEQLELVGYQDVRGDWPRNFALTPNDEFVVVANQRSNNLVAFKRDVQSGLLTYMSELGADAPVCVLFK